MAKIRQGTRLPALKAQAYTEAGFVDLTQFVTLTFRMVSGSIVVTGAATGDVNGNLTYNWGPSDTAVVGVYAAYFIGTDSGGKVETFPSDQNLTIEIIPTI